MKPSVLFLLLIKGGFSPHRGPEANPKNACVAAGHPDDGPCQPEAVPVGRPQRGPVKFPGLTMAFSRPVGLRLCTPGHFHRQRPWAPRNELGHPGAVHPPPCSCGFASAFRRERGAAPSSRRPSALRHGTLFNLGEGNTSAFPSQHLFSVANPGNTRPFYLLRKE